MAILLLILSAIVALIGAVWFLVVAFRVHVLWGLGCIFLPFVSLVFLFLHFSKVWKPLTLHLIAVVVAIASLAREVPAGISPNRIDIDGNEGRVRSVLRSYIFPTQLKFKASKYADQDKDGIGEYALLEEMIGGPVVGQDQAIRLYFMFPYFQGHQHEAHGYRIVIHLPDGLGGAITDQVAARPADAVAADEQEKYFIAYAWPLDEQHGHHVYAVTQEGRVFQAPDSFTGIPTWNAVFGGKGWESQPVWAAARQ